MELIEEDTVVVLTTSVTAPTRMLTVLPDTSMTRRDVPSFLAVFGESGRL